MEETSDEGVSVVNAWADEYYWLNSHNNVNPRGRSNIYARNLQYENFAEELIREEPVDAGAGLQVTKLTIPFEFTQAFEDPRLITRPNTRAVYEAVFSMILHDASAKRILVEGAPGIGKSRNLIYLLKLLFGENRKVIYHSAAEQAVYVFVPPSELLGTRATAGAPSNRYRCYTTSENLFLKTPEKNLTRDPRNVYLYDSSLALGEPPQVNCFVVLVASPNAKHLSNFTRGYNTRLFKINHFLYEEVVAFFAILYPLAEFSYSRLAPAGNLDDSFPTKLGRVLSREENFPLCPEHLEYGFYEVKHIICFM